MNLHLHVLIVAWSALLGSAAWRFRPIPGRDPRVDMPPVAPASSTDRGRPAGAVARVRAGAVEGSLVGRVVRRLVGRRASDRRQREFVDQLAEVVEMMRIATSSGLTAGPALEIAQRHAPSGRDAGLGHVVERLRRGESLGDAMSAWVERHGPPADELAALVRAADRSGVAIGPGLHRLSRELRRRRRVDAETRARRLPVTTLAPLVMCVLPAFGLITVVPMIVVGVSGLGP